MLEVQQARLRRGGFALEVPALAVAEGERISLIGPSGSGKSTLLRLLAGLEATATLERLAWNGTDLTQAAPHRRPFAWMAQDLGLWPHLSALQHLAFARTGGRSVRDDPSDAEALARAQLQHRAAARPAELSGGEQQRLAMARAIAMRRPFALLDEPFAHLDPVTADQLDGTFRDLTAAAGVGVIQVSHQVTRRMAGDRFWVIEGGRLTQDGRWNDLADTPHTPWIERFIALQAA